MELKKFGAAANLPEACFRLDAFLRAALVGRRGGARSGPPDGRPAAQQSGGSTHLESRET